MYIDNTLYLLYTLYMLNKHKQSEAIMNNVRFYKEAGKEVTNETLHTLCVRCARPYELRFGIKLETIDVAGDWDECGLCGTQNTPESDPFCMSAWD